MLSNRRMVYVVFDRFPAPKGAAVHIAAFARALGEAFGPIDLVTLGDGTPVGRAPPTTPAGLAPTATQPIIHHPLPIHGRDILARVMTFRARLGRWWQGRKVPVVHFRSIFEGYPLAAHKDQVCDKLVFEVNGLPSIELKYHYPSVALDGELLKKLLAQERRCIEAADLLVTVSPTNAAHLISRGADPAKIRVIPNGVDLDLFPYAAPRPWPNREIRLLYSGTVATWQGVTRAIEALALLRRDYPASLTLVGPATRARLGELCALAHDLKIDPHVQFLDPLPQGDLARLHHECDVALAPLPRNDRNLIQGCCPLKVIEAMASGTPLIASDLPVVSCLAVDGAEAIIVKPGSSKAIKDGVLRLLADPQLGPRLSRAARAKVERCYTWDIAGAALVRAYEEVLGISRLSTRPSDAASTAG